MHKVLKLILFALFCCQSFQLGAQQKYALLVAVDDYYADPGIKHQSSLKGCVNDARSMKQLLLERFGYDEKNIVSLYNDAVTKKRFIEEMFRMLRPGGMLIAAREHVISRESDLGAFLEQHPLHHLYGGEHAYLLDRYVGALKTAGFAAIEVLAPLRSPINLFPYTIDTLRAAIVERLTDKIPVRPIWQAALASRSVFTSLLSVAEPFDDRPGRLYSFVCRKAPA